MDMDELQEKPKIGMLLDIINLYGEHEGRMGPWMIVLAIAGTPVMFYAYFALWTIIPIPVFAVVDLLVTIRAIMIFPGRESYRKEIFRRQLHDQYTATSKLLNVKMIHPDGLIEYLNGNVMYLVVCFNGTVDDTVQRSVQVRKLLDSMIGDFEYDVYIHNLNDSDALRQYYTKVNSFAPNQSAKNFIKMIDHNIKLTQDTSLVQCTIYAIRARKGQYRVMRTQIDSALKSKTSHCYKLIYRVTDADEINAIFNRNSDSIINMEQLMRRKYATSEYANSKVLAYDLPDDQVIIQGKDAVEPVIPEQTKSSFHQVYKESGDET